MCIRVYLICHLTEKILMSVEIFILIEIKTQVNSRFEHLETKIIFHWAITINDTKLLAREKRTYT